MARPGRPRTNPLPRAEQLRLAKRGQRLRERERGLETVELRLPAEPARRLRAAAQLPEFRTRLEEFLEGEIVRVANYPALRSLLWSGRRPELLPAGEAFRLYERHWRFIDEGRLDGREAALIERLKQRHGKGLLNA